MKKVNRKFTPFFLFFRSCTANSDLMNKVCTLVHVWELLSYLKFIFWALSLLGRGSPLPAPPILIFHLQIKTENKNSANQLFSSVQFSCSVMSHSLLPHESQHAKASLSITNSLSSLRLPSSQWCHPAISSSVVPFSSCPQSLPASEGNRWGNTGNNVRLYFIGLQNHCRWWLQPWN